MSKKSISEKVGEIVLPIVESKGLELVEVEYVKEGPNWFLRVYIDKESGITIDDCQLVSEEISDKLDKNDPISNSYYLEVSSPGLERPLKKDRDFEKNKGRIIEVRLFKAINDKNNFEGELLGLEDGKVVIKINEEIYKFERQNVSLVKKVFKF